MAEWPLGAIICGVLIMVILAGSAAVALALWIRSILNTKH